jgi:hypothetical protein
LARLIPRVETSGTFGNPLRNMRMWCAPQSGAEQIFIAAAPA